MASQTGKRATRWAGGCVAIMIAGCAGPDAGTSSSEEGACAAPNFTLSTPSVAPGDEIELRGEGFLLGCGDAPGVTDGTPAPRESDAGLRDLSVVWLQGDGPATELARVDADSGGLFDLTVTVPEGAVPGSATIRVAPALEDATLTVEP